jgi:hypothetical protein
MYSTRSVNYKLKSAIPMILEIEGKRHSFNDSYIGSTSLNTDYASIEIVTEVFFEFSESIILLHNDSSYS